MMTNDKQHNTHNKFGTRHLADGDSPTSTRRRRLADGQLADVTTRRRNNSPTVTTRRRNNSPTTHFKEASPKFQLIKKF